MAHPHCSCIVARLISCGLRLDPGSPTGLGRRIRTCPDLSPSVRLPARVARETMAMRFLPAVYQGTTLGRASQPSTEAKIRHLNNDNWTPAEQQRMFQQLQELNRKQIEKRAGDDELSAVVESYELAYRMQMKAPARSTCPTNRPKR